MHKFLNLIFSPLIFALLLVSTAFSMAIGTFIGNDYGLETAHNFVYSSFWFTVLLALLSINMLGQIFMRRMYRREQFSVFLFHLAFILILLGGGITRYIGYEGVMHIREGEASNELILNDKSLDKRMGSETTLKVIKQLDFEVYLNDFEIERYPGSQSPSSYASAVSIRKQGQELFSYRIYMNHILKYDGFRFYQSSYDEDEKGTILSVNHDAWGTAVTYLGYFLMILGMLLSMLNRRTFLWKPRFQLPKASLILLLILTGSATFAQNQTKQVVAKDHAEAFGRLLLQNPQGRTEPIHTFSSAALRKISRKKSWKGLSPSQVYLDMHLNTDYWTQEAMIKIGHEGIRAILGIQSNYAAYRDLIQGQNYRLQEYVERAYATPPAQRSTFDKEVLKVDERVSICYSIYTGAFLRLFPIPDDASNHWYTPQQAHLQVLNNPADSAFLATIVPLYYQELQQAKQNGDYSIAQEILFGLQHYQRQYANYKLPSEFKVQLEMMNNKAQIFERLFRSYSSLGFLLLVVGLLSIIRGRKQPKIIVGTLHLLLFMAFLFHTLGLIIRWYLSGHAPLSNGYESMLFITWVTMLAGVLFRKSSALVLASTALLAGIGLMVAHLSYMDPQITNLVPVLQSYWLTLHVSVITGSYGFLSLGMLLGILNLLLFIFRNPRNRQHIDATLLNLTQLNNKTITFGLYFLSIGTFLGGIWANESWGRYWGWDPKETWSLITIFVYAFVSHARMIPGLRGVYSFNLLTIYAYFSVMMTYFGVNYYLSGLHSYAAGDPVPVPNFVYYTVGALLLLSIGSFVQMKRQAKTF